MKLLKTSYYPELNNKSTLFNKKLLKGIKGSYPKIIIFSL